ncbi:MAG: glycerol-3-phosphate acyltransferase, partial [Candidatus Sumerlaeota bacterium]|nr:glycerol-3-phosphate acyltransferase [Candidatus Sumerlaeota bacterium]
MVPLVLILLAGYLIGGIPNSYLLVRLTKGIDLRTIGSGNVGATNACRVFQRPWSMVVFLVCFLLDAAKGYLPAHFLAPYLAHGPAGGLDPATHVLLIGLAAILGHVYTPYLGFKGGKGVATTLGVFLAAAPLALAIALGIGGILI